MTDDDIKKTLEHHLEVLSECINEVAGTVKDGGYTATSDLCMLIKAYNDTLKKTWNY